MFSQLLDALPFLAWSLTWIAGGWLAVIGFNVPRREQWIMGVSLGLVAELWFSNLFVQVLPVLPAFWLGGLVTLAFGILFAWPRLRTDFKGLFSLSWGQLVALALIVYLFAVIGFGLNIFDDRQNLPTVSLMATGDVPPHFALDSKFIFSYHYLLLLFGAQMMRLGSIFAWTALDLARAVAFGLTVMLAYLWTRRMARSHVAGILGAAFMAFASGTRWFLLLLPPAMVDWISSHVTMIGSGLLTADSLSQALTKPWAIEGAGPIAFPFAFVNGLNSAGIMNHNGTGMLGMLAMMLVLMLYRRWHDLKGGLTIVVLLAASALVSEFGFLTLLPNLALAVLVSMYLRRTWKIPRSAIPWAVVVVAASVIALVQGGVLTSIAEDLLAKLTGGVQSGYHTFNLVFAMPPTVISAHLGTLSLADPAQLLAALFEVGPILLVLPLLYAWGLKMARHQRWWEAMLVAGAATGWVVLFVQYAGSAGVSANSRLFGNIITPAALYAVPLGWAWAKKKVEWVRAGLGAVALAILFGGMVLFGVELAAIQKPVLPVFLHPLDARMSKLYWDRLEPGAQVFDPNPTRAVTIFGRYSDSYETWYIPRPEWEALVLKPDPRQLHQAGFRYMYFGAFEWENWDKSTQALLEDACVKVVDEVKGIRAPDDARKDFRRLLDISACQ